MLKPLQKCYQHRVHLGRALALDPMASAFKDVAAGYSFTEAALIDTDITQFFVSGPEGMKIELQCRREDV